MRVYGLEKVKGDLMPADLPGKIDAGSDCILRRIKSARQYFKSGYRSAAYMFWKFISLIVQSAGVKSADKGFTVEASEIQTAMQEVILVMAAVCRIKDSDVMSLKHTKIIPPGDSLESANGESYFGGELPDMRSKAENTPEVMRAAWISILRRIDSAAAVGGGLKLLGNIKLTNLLEALNVVASTIQNSDVYRLCRAAIPYWQTAAMARIDNLGKAGGFIGEMSGTIIKNSDAKLFAYVIGREAAEGYAGIMVTGKC